MGRLFFVIIVLTVHIGIAGCGHTSLYKNWGGQLRGLPARNGKVDDVSAVLGRSPSRCEVMKDVPPVIGIIFDEWQGRPVIYHVTAGSPAYDAGIRPGDIIKSINRQPVVTSEQAQSALVNNVREGQALEIKTSRGIASVIPRRLKMEQCYWEVRQEGTPTLDRSVVGSDRQGDSPASGGTPYERFFWASCRVLNGFVTVCRWDWQE